MSLPHNISWVLWLVAEKDKRKKRRRKEKEKGEERRRDEMRKKQQSSYFKVIFLGPDDKVPVFLIHLGPEEVIVLLLLFKISISIWVFCFVLKDLLMYMGVLPECMSAHHVQAWCP